MRTISSRAVALVIVAVAGLAFTTAGARTSDGAEPAAKKSSAPAAGATKSARRSKSAKKTDAAAKPARGTGNASLVAYTICPPIAHLTGVNALTAGPSADIKVDGTVIGTVPGCSYRTLKAPVGHRFLSASLSGLGFLPVLNLFGPNFNAVAGKTHYLRVRYNGNYFETTQVTRAEAMADIQQIKSLNK